VSPSIANVVSSPFCCSTRIPYDKSVSWSLSSLPSLLLEYALTSAHLARRLWKSPETLEQSEDRWVNVGGTIFLLPELYTSHREVERSSQLVLMSSLKDLPLPLLDLLCEADQIIDRGGSRKQIDSYRFYHK